MIIRKAGGGGCMVGGCGWMAGWLGEVGGQPEVVVSGVRVEGRVRKKMEKVEGKEQIRSGDNGRRSQGRRG